MKKMMIASLILSCLLGSNVEASQQVPQATAKPAKLADLQGLVTDSKTASEATATAAAEPVTLTRDQQIAQERVKLKKKLKAAGIEVRQEHSRSYNGTQIDMKTLAELAPKAPESVMKFLAANTDLTDVMLGNENLAGERRAIFRETFHPKAKAAMAKAGVENLSDYNYVFRVPGTEQIVAIAGHLNRRETTRRLADVLLKKPELGEWGRVLTEADYQLFTKELADSESYTFKAGDKTEKRPKTYQTISRVAAYLLFKDVEKRRQFKHIVVPQTYLAQIPGRSADVDDNNYVVAQDMIEDLEEVGQLTAAEELEVATVIHEVGIFCCNPGSLKRRKSDKKIVFLDFEQPNNSNPREFFHQNFKTVEWNGDAGLWDYAANFLVAKK